MESSLDNCERARQVRETPTVRFLNYEEKRAVEKVGSSVKIVNAMGQGGYPIAT
jgi:hypothetical protein